MEIYLRHEFEMYIAQLEISKKAMGIEILNIHMKTQILLYGNEQEDWDRTKAFNMHVSLQYKVKNIENNQ